MSPVFKAANDGQEFSVVDIIVSFGRVERLRMVSDGSLLPRSFMFLVQDCPSGECRGVDFQGKLFEGVRSVKDGVVKGDVNQFFNGLGVRIGP